jgi:hypothetical protein
MSLATLQEALQSAAFNYVQKNVFEKFLTYVLPAAFPSSASVSIMQDPDTGVFAVTVIDSGGGDGISLGVAWAVANHRVY